MARLYLSLIMLIAIGTFMSASRGAGDAGDVADQVIQETISWSRGPDIPLPRGGYYASWYEGGLLIAGGTYWKDGKKLWTDSVSHFEPARNRWVEWPPLPLTMAYGVMAQVRGKLYLIGGMINERLSLDVFRLDGRSWTRIGEAPSGSIYGAATVVGKKIYVLGGGDSNNDLTTATNQTWSFDPATNRWERLAGFPGKPRVVHGVVSIGESIYLFGGATQSKGGPLIDLNDAYRFDTVSKKWSTLKRMPQASRALGVTVARGSIYLIGGVNQKGLDTVYVYQPVQDEYRLVSHLPSPLLDSKFFFKNGSFYGATGEDKARSRFPGLYMGRLSTSSHK
jgi:N-acetylneuraminic acid mutarotase